MSTHQFDANKSRICYDIYCETQKIPFFLSFLTFTVGIMSSLTFEYLHNMYFDLNGVWMPLCIFGFHFHHLFTGIIITVISLIFIIKEINKEKKTGFIIALLFQGIGLGLILGDILTHFVFQREPFELFCP